MAVLMLGLLTGAANGQTATSETVISARQGDVLILYLDETACALAPLAFGRQYLCDSDGRLIVGVDFQTIPGTYAVSPTQSVIRVTPRSWGAPRHLMLPSGRNVDAKIRAAERERIDAALRAGPRLYPSWPAQREFRAPLVDTEITSKFGVQSVFRTQQGRPAGTDWHRGVDLRAAQGTPVTAASYGAVVLAEQFSVEGNMVILYHGSGVYTLYLHLSHFACIPGQIVNSGQSVGYTGGESPHLHFQVIVNGAVVEPLGALQALKTASAPR